MNIQHMKTLHTLYDAKNALLDLLKVLCINVCIKLLHNSNKIAVHHSFLNCDSEQRKQGGLLYTHGQIASLSNTNSIEVFQYYLLKWCSVSYIIARQRYF